MKTYLLTLLLLAPPLSAQTLSVIHEKALWPDGGGKIEITDTGIVYTAEKPKESRNWRYQDIQYLDRISVQEFTILTYEDQRLLLGRDREYRFRINDGRLTDELFRFISGKLGKPVTDRVVGEVPAPEYTVPVKHLHTFGGCEGTLEFTKDAIYYRTGHKEDAREWRLARDVQSVWSADRFEMEIHAYDNNRREASQTRRYRFQLKKPLDPSFYRRLKLKLYDLARVHLPG